MEQVLEWGLDTIRLIQSIKTPGLDTLFIVITSFGDEMFFIILLTLVYWSVDKRAGARLAFALFLSAYVNSFFKEIWKLPRPFEADPTVAVIREGGYSLPSGHSQMAVTVWGIVAFELKRKWFWIVAIFLMLSIGFSRVYLGVHYPTDVLAGWGFGIVILVLYILFVERIERWVKSWNFWLKMGVSFVLPIIMAILLHEKNAVTVAGGLFGLGVGLTVAGRFLKWSVAGSFRRRTLRFIVGFIGLAIIFIGLRLIFPAENSDIYYMFVFIRYAVIGIWVTLGAPAVFLLTSLAVKEDDL
jgi:membrane-associated phospholipid phosphatase